MCAPEWILKALSAQVDIVEHSLAKYALELSLLCYELSWVRPSEQAAAALCLALQLDGKAWDPTLTHYGRFSQAQLAPTVAKMAALMLDADKGKHTVGLFRSYGELHSHICLYNSFF